MRGKRVCGADTKAMCVVRGCVGQTLTKAMCVVRGCVGQTLTKAMCAE